MATFTDSRYSNIAWAFEKNSSFLDTMIPKRRGTKGYLKLIDGLLATLIQNRVEGIQEKIRDIGPNNLFKFQSTISELKVAHFLSAFGKRIKLLPDDFLSGKSPDMLVVDALGESYVEVTRFSDDETMSMMFDGVNRILEDRALPYNIDVGLSSVLSEPAVGHEERKEKVAIVKKILEDFDKAMDYGELPKLPTTINIDRVSFSITKSPRSKGSAGTISTNELVLSAGQFSSRIRFLVSDPKYGKASKRESWSGSDRSKYYMIAIDVEQPFFDSESALTALLGSRVHYSYEPPRVAIPSFVKTAAQKGWSNYLEKMHLIPKAKTVFNSYGAYVADPICKNVSGVLILTENRKVFIPNPFASDEINNPELVHFLGDTA